MTTKLCPKCGQECEGEDLGDHPAWLDFSCECGYSWGANCMDEYYAQADFLRKRMKEEGV